MKPRTPLNTLSRQRPLVTAVCRALLCSALALPPLAIADNAAPAREYALPASTLGAALGEFAAQAGVVIYFDAAITNGLQSPPLHGRYGVEDGLDNLLRGSGLRAVKSEDGSYTLVKAEATEVQLAPVRVQASAATDGSAEQGYRSETVSAVGPWQGRKLQDTPYSITVISEELIENLQAMSPDQIYRVAPTVQLTRPQSAGDQAYVNMRGFEVRRTYRDGAPIGVFNHGVATEDVEHVEIFTGLSGFLYGPGNVGGMINNVSKGPTAERMNRVTLGNTGGSNYYLHGDFGGPIDSGGRLGYRINGVWQDGETAIDNQDIEKQLISGAVDWHMTDTLLWQFNASYRDYETEGRTADWALAPGVARPSAKDIDSSKSWSQPWARSFFETELYGNRLRWDPSEMFALRAAYSYGKTRRNQGFTTNTIQSDGTYTQSLFSQYVDRFVDRETTIETAQAFGDVLFDTGIVAHKLTIGVQHVDQAQSRPRNTNPPITYSGLTLNRPTYFDKPVIAYLDGGARRHSDQSDTTLSIGDDITFNEHWSVLAGLAHSTIELPADGYEESAVTPNISVVYKPVEAISTYVTYIEALEQGGMAGDAFNGVPVVNAGEVMQPLMSEQVEIGVKARVGDMLLTTALFQIDKGLQYYDASNPAAPVFVQDGRQVHRGIEFTAFGKLTDNLTLVGGFTLLDAKVRE